MSGYMILRITDKWSKRRFAVKLSQEQIPQSTGEIFRLVGRIDRADLEAWVRQKVITKDSVGGFKDIQQALFEIKDDGSLGKLLDDVYLTYNGQKLGVDDPIPLEVYNSEQHGKESYLADLILDRDNVPYARNWKGYYRRNWEKKFDTVVRMWIKCDYGERSDEILSLTNELSVKNFLSCIAKNIHRAPYELYSRYLGRFVPFKTASETLLSIVEGRGGNCSEKASALDLICTNFGIDSRLCLSGHNASGKFPEYHLRAALERSSTIFAGEKQRYWEHFANIVTVGQERVLIDATGGPMPFLFSVGDEAVEYLEQKRWVTVNYIAREECFYYHDAPVDISYGALFNMEVFQPDIDMYHIFGVEGEDSPFGLLIKPDLWICPDAYKSDNEFYDHWGQWNSYAAGAPRIAQLEFYKDLSDSVDKPLLRDLTVSESALISDLRSIEESFVKRCRHVWRDEQWNIGYVFCSLKQVH